MIIITDKQARIFLDAIWENQCSMGKNGEVVICSYWCNEINEFTGHKPDCNFLGIWNELENIRQLLGDTRIPKMSE